RAAKEHRDLQREEGCVHFAFAKPRKVHVTCVVQCTQIVAHHQDALNGVDVAVDSDRLRHELPCSCKHVFQVRLVNAATAILDDRLCVGTPRLISRSCDSFCSSSRDRHAQIDGSQTCRRLAATVSTTSSMCPESISLPIAKAKPATCSAVTCDGNETAFGSVIASTSAGPG